MCEGRHADVELKSVRHRFQKITHSYQVVGADTEFLGVISPGAWVE